MSNEWSRDTFARLAVARLCVKLRGHTNAWQALSTFHSVCITSTKLRDKGRVTVGSDERSDPLLITHCSVSVGRNQPDS